MPDNASHEFSLLLAFDGKETRIAARTPFTIGRSPDMNLVLPYPYISRRHAEIHLEPSSQRLELVSVGTECFVNGTRVTHHLLAPGDQIRLGFLQGPLLSIPEKNKTTGSSLRATLDHLKEPSGTDADLAKLSWFVKAARRLNDVGAVQEILAALIDTTIELTRVERGYVFLRDPAGELTLAAGRSRNAENIEDSSTLSHSAIRQSIESGSDFIVTDTLSAESAPTHSIVAQSIRAIICIPLRKRSPAPDTQESGVIGVLYLDSRQQRGHLTRLDSDLLRTIATEATLLVENATLAQAEAAARRYREELIIASEIQQGLMSVRIPDLPFAEVKAHSIPCKGIGGDFYDVLCHDGALYIVVADISGKGVSAAVLGSTLQGLIHGQILSGLPLTEIALFANQYICNRSLRKYATLFLLRLAPNGNVEYVNCGHVQPLLHGHAGESVAAHLLAADCNLPVGLFADATYCAESLRLEPGQRLVVLTDGMTEAEDPSGEYFGDHRLQSLIGQGAPLRQLFDELKTFTSGAELEDDCTMVEIRYGAHDAAAAS